MTRTWIGALYIHSNIDSVVIDTPTPVKFVQSQFDGHSTNVSMNSRFGSSIPSTSFLFQKYREINNVSFSFNTINTNYTDKLEMCTSHDSTFLFYLWQLRKQNQQTFHPVPCYFSCQNKFVKKSHSLLRSTCPAKTIAFGSHFAANCKQRHVIVMASLFPILLLHFEPATHKIYLPFLIGTTE